MGVSIEVAPSGGFTDSARDSVFLQVDTYILNESSTPLSGSDSSGGVGTIAFSTPYRDDYVTLRGRDVRVTDNARGTTEGFVSSIGRQDESGMVSITCTLRTGRLNIFNVQASPFTGTLASAFEYYLSLADQDIRFQVDPDISDRQVSYPGWNGELWFYLKQLAAAEDADISLISGLIVLRKIRERTIQQDHDISRGVSIADGQLARSVDVYYYNNQPIVNKLVYPPGGWTPEVTPITVAAGETITETVLLSSSVTSISQPEIQTFVSRTHDTSSVYTVVGDDGLPITPAAWAGGGGSLSVAINPDTVSLDVTIVAPSDLRSITGEKHSTYSIAIGDDGGRFSTLRIVGSGVAFDKKVMNLSTGVDESLTAQDVGATVDNVFISSPETAHRVGMRTVREYSGGGASLSYSVSSVSRFDDPGGVTFTSNQAVDTLYSAISWTNEMVDSQFSALTNVEVDRYFSNLIAEDRITQVMGNVSGARLWDRRSHHWYRVRTSNITPGPISGEADIDTTYGDAQDHWAGLTYGELEDLFAGNTYGEVEMRGLID